MNDKKPNIGQKINLKYGVKTVESWFTYNPFCQEEDKLGFLYVNAISKNLHWTEMLPNDEYEIITS